MMSKAWRSLPPFVLLFAFAAMLPLQGSAQGAGRYYPETGHTLDERFVPFYDLHGGQEILGLPITEAFTDPLTGHLIQYLENNRLELEDGTPGEPVSMPMMGEWMGGSEPPLEPHQRASSSSTGCRFYPQSGHQVCHAFLDYYLAMGGPALFGYPVSEFKLEEGRIVQYFQLFRLDWHPEAHSGEQVKVAPLGRLHFDREGYDRGLLQPQLPANGIEYRVTELEATISLGNPVMSATGTQHVYVVVRDQQANPVAGVGVVLVASFPEGERVFIMPATDTEGVSRLEIAFKDQAPGTHVGLQVLALRGSLEATTRDSFSIWW